MSYFFGLSINRSQHVACAVAPFARPLSMQTGNAGGWGLGYYARGELLQHIAPKDKGEPLDVEEVVGDLEAEILIMHTRVATVGRPHRDNIHPFRFREWLFAHNGTIAGFDAIRDEMLNAMPQFIRRGIRGDTDSQHLFHLFLAFLYDAGMLGRPNPGVFQIRDALDRALSTVDEFAKDAGAHPSPASVILSDGYSLVVMNRGIPVDYARIEGIADCANCRPSVRPGEDAAARVEHPEVRAVLVRSGDLGDSHDSALTPLPENSFLLVAPDQAIEVSSLS